MVERPIPDPKENPKEFKRYIEECMAELERERAAFPYRRYEEMRDNGMIQRARDLGWNDAMIERALDITIPPEDRRTTD